MNTLQYLGSVSKSELFVPEEGELNANGKSEKRVTFGTDSKPVKKKNAF